MLTMHLWVTGIIILSETCICSCHRPSKPGTSDAEMPVKVEPVLIHQLGSEHLGNAIYRIGTEGPRIAASGNRIIEWPIRENAPLTEVVPYKPENYNNGACSMDVNGDGIDEMIVARTVSKEGTDLFWYEEIPGEKLWKEHLIAYVANKGGEEGIHDIMPFVFKDPGNNIKGVVIVVNRRRVLWYQIPDNVTQQWREHHVADLTDSGAKAAQSGLVTGNIAGNGNPDIVCGNFWAECPAHPDSDPWKVYRYSNWDKRSTPVFPEVPAWVAGERFGGMNQLDLGDMDGDGNADIVATDAEIPNARLGIFRRDLVNPDSLWYETVIDTGLYCPHNLVVTDVNKDSRPDIITGEMTAGGWWFPKTQTPRLYLYLNLGNMKFRKYILHEGRGIHMMVMAKGHHQDNVFVFASDEIQSWYPEMTTHVVGWTISPK